MSDSEWSLTSIGGGIAKPGLLPTCVGYCAEAPVSSPVFAPGQGVSPV